MTNKKVLVVGGSGFLGSHVADELTNKGFKVTIFDQKKSKWINKNQKCFKSAYLPWWANEPYSPGLGSCAGVI